MTVRYKKSINRRPDNGGKYAGQFIKITAVVNPEFKLEGKTAANFAIAHAMVRSLKRFTPVDTGLLRRSWVIYKSTSRSFEVANYVFYGVFQDGGTAKIAARRFVAKALRQINTYVKRYYGATPTQMFTWTIVEYRKDSYKGNPATEGVLK